MKTYLVVALGAVCLSACDSATDLVLENPLVPLEMLPLGMALDAADATTSVVQPVAVVGRSGTLVAGALEGAEEIVNLGAASVACRATDDKRTVGGGWLYRRILCSDGREGAVSVGQKNWFAESFEYWVRQDFGEPDCIGSFNLENQAQAGPFLIQCQSESGGAPRAAVAEVLTEDEQIVQVTIWLPVR